MKLLPNVAWNFSRTDYPTADEFNRAVADYNRKVLKGRANWQPDQVIVEHPTVDVMYECWARKNEPLTGNEQLMEAYADDEFEEREVVVRFTADNGRQFTALELLHKIHRQLRSKELGDHTFFEGLAPGEDQDEGATPVYHLYCGS